MKEIMLSDTPAERREQILRDNCDQIEEKYYTRKFNQEETNERREELADISIKISETEAELKNIKDSFKIKMKPLTEKKEKLLQELKTGGEYINGNVYKFIDTEEGKAAWYTPEGHLIEERNLRPEERQRSIYHDIRIIKNEL
jgi:predicted phage tail protein